jgi:hypothetical protein
MDGCLVQEDLLAAIVGSDETETFLRVEPLDLPDDLSLRHWICAEPSGQTK